MKILQKYGLALFFVVLVGVHLLVINDYGLTWDFHFHFFGGGHLLGLSPEQLEPKALPYVEPDPRRAINLPYGPIMSIPPVLAFVWLYKNLHILAADSAYNLPGVLWGLVGIAIVYAFVKEAVSKKAGIIAAIFLALTPRFFGDMHNNMKDVPSAAVFALNMWLLWRLVKHKRLIDLVLAVIAFAVAFNVKINSVFIPFIFLAWLIIRYWARGGVSFGRIITALTGNLYASKKHLDLDNARTRNTDLSASPLSYSYFLLAPLVAFLLWWFFWPNPIAQLDHAYRTFGIGTNNIEVLLNGDWYCSGSTVPWYYPLWYLGITTPLPILIFFIVGFATTLRHWKHNSTHLLFVFWFTLPLSRYLLPSIGVIDGVRHFEEVLFPIAILAGIAFDKTLTYLAKDKLPARTLIVGTICWLLWNIITYHPYQITYFNELVGGARGAFGKYDLDYWGTSQKQAIEWINANAKPNARVYIVMAPNVAGTYLRPDLLPNLNKFGYDQADYVVFLNRQSFFYRFYYAYEYLLAHTPTHTISVAGAPLVWIFDNQTNNTTPRQAPWWKGDDPCIIQYWKTK